MQVEKPSFREWSEYAAGLLESVNDLELMAERLLHAVESLSRTGESDITIAVFNRRAVLTRVWRRPILPADADYVTEAYELDPVFTAITEADTSGCILLPDLVPPGFEKSELYRLFFHERGNLDGLIHLTRLDDGFVVVGLQGGNRLSQTEIERHRAMYPIIAACSSHIARLSRVPEGEEKVDSALERFAADVVTPREQNVIQLVLRGHNSESIGQRLGISPNTVKRHRLGAYAKLGITSQGELFHAFLRTIGLQSDSTDELASSLRRADVSNRQAAR